MIWRRPSATRAFDGLGAFGRAGARSGEPDGLCAGAPREEKMIRIQRFDAPEWPLDGAVRALPGTQAGRAAERRVAPILSFARHEEPQFLYNDGVFARRVSPGTAAADSLDPPDTCPGESGLLEPWSRAGAGKRREA